MNIIKRAALRVLNMTREEYIKAFTSGEDIPYQSEGPVDTSAALKYSAVFACCRIISETFASVPILLYKKDAGTNEREQVNDLGIYDVLHNAPNEEMSHFNFSESMMMGICTRGNGVSQRLVNAKGEIIGLYPIHANISRDKETRKLVYKVQGGGKETTFKRSEVFHVPGPSLDGIIGLSPLELAGSAIRLGMSYERFGLEFYKNSANPSGAFQTERGLSEEAFERLKKELKDNYTGLRNTGTPLLLEEGLKWQQITISPADAQLLESKNFQIEDICRIYRVPQHLVNKLDRSTNNNIEHQALEFVVYTMLPYFKRYEECVNAQLLTPEERKKGYYFEHKIDGLLRGDSKARAEFYASGRQWGWLCVNDIRKLENMSSLGPAGDIFLTPTNMQEAGTQQSANASDKILQEIHDIMEKAGKA